MDRFIFLVTGYLQKLGAGNELHELFPFSTENDPSVLVLKIVVKPMERQLFSQNYNLNHKYISWFSNFHQCYLQESFHHQRECKEGVKIEQKPLLLQTLFSRLFWLSYSYFLYF